MRKEKRREEKRREEKRREERRREEKRVVKRRERIVYAQYSLQIEEFREVIAHAN